MKKYFLLLLTCFFISPVLGKSITNKELLSACKNTNPAPQNFCYGFIIATSNAAQFYRNIVDVKDEFVDICFPDDISNKDIVNEYVTWAEKNPSFLGTPAFVGVSTSFSIKYSCKEKEKAKE